LGLSSDEKGSELYHAIKGQNCEVQATGKTVEIVQVLVKKLEEI
jgi:hypothetical protein